jgi:glycine/D-amino acid oxidase-like deaminating enzyme
VRGLQQSHGRVTGVQLDDGTLACDTVVLAMGPWAQEAEAWLGLSIPVRPLKGEILRMEFPGPGLAYDFASLTGCPLSAKRQAGIMSISPLVEKRRAFY